MTEQQKGKLKKHTINGAKLIAAIGTLTAAVNGYLDLEKKNELVLQALASKINALSQEVAYLKGRLDATAAVEAVPAEPTPPPAEPVMMDEVGEGAGDEGAEAAVEVEAVAEVAEDVKPIKAKRQIKLDAYEAVPTTMQELQQLQLRQETADER